MEAGFEVDERDGPSVVTLLGEHDIATVDELAERVDALFAERRQIVVDLSRIEFMDSSVLALLLRWTREAQLSAGEAFAVALGPSKSVAARTMAVIGALDYIPCFSNRELALAALAEGLKPRPARQLEKMTDPQLEAARLEAADESQSGATPAVRDVAARRLGAILREQQSRVSGSHG